MIRQLAEEKKATLITSDMIQAEVAKALGVSVIHVASEMKQKKLMFLKYFKPNYMSVHLKEGEPPRAKAGQPGDWRFVEVSKAKLKGEELEKIAEQIVEATRMLKGSFLEIERKGSIIAQIQEYRIVVTRPPLSDAWEITLVRPVKKLKLDDYNLGEILKGRFRKGAEGILIAGAPGHGKSTFAQALAKEYADLNKVVKALESPRDMQLPKSVTQYAYSKSSHSEIKDILLLARPDYTIFDEVRNTGDFALYSDLRLSGVGMVGVVHANDPIDAIQRFIGKIELGMIPSIVDTVVFIRDGRVHKVLGIKMEVKVPAGMTESDLARPIVSIYDFETGSNEYEIYTYGEATVVMPIKAVAQPRKFNRELRWRLKETGKYFDFIFFTPTPKVEVILSGVMVASLPVQKGRSLKIFKKSKLGKEITHSLRTRAEIRFE